LASGFPDFRRVGVYEARATIVRETIGNLSERGRRLAALARQFKAGDECNGVGVEVIVPHRRPPAALSVPLRGRRQAGERSDGLRAGGGLPTKRKAAPSCPRTAIRGARSRVRRCAGVERPADIVEKRRLQYCQQSFFHLKIALVAGVMKRSQDVIR
jgi:hypothetical protein